MEITVSIRMYNHINYKQNERTFTKLGNDGWRVSKSERGMFTTTYYFSKIL